MPIGVLCGCGAVLLGGLIGTVCGKYIDDETKELLTTIFGLAAIGNGSGSHYRHPHRASP